MTVKRILRRSRVAKTTFDELVKNAVEFLTNALDEFGRDPNRSVIDFYTAVELFLKARLLQEHWTLVVSKEPNKDKFRTGDFVSVTFEEASKRLRDVVGSPLPDAAAQSFDSLRRHRNRMVHFFHDASDEAKSNIALGQLQAWFQLNRLVANEWAPYFDAYSSVFVKMERHLVKHKEYAVTKFSGLKEEIERQRADGAKFICCRSCKLKAAKIDSEIEWRPAYQCLVCRDSWMVARIACPECGKNGQVNVDADFRCSKCSHFVHQEELFSLFDEAYYDHDQILCGECDTPASCSECEGFETVCEHQGKYFCVNCFEVFENIYSCGWCSSKHSSMQRDSYFSGCNYCDGHSTYYEKE